MSVLSGTLFAIMLLCALLVLGNLFKEIRPLLVDMGAPVWILWDFILGVLPVSLIYTIPWAFLSAVLLVFGRLSSDNELNAFRAAGIGLTRLSVPVLLLGILLSCLCMWLNIKVAPEAKRKVEDIVTNTIIQDPRSLLRAGVDQTRIRNVKVDSEYSRGDVFHNFHIFVMDDSEDSGIGGAYIHADTAETVVDEENKQIRLKLTGAYSDGPAGPNKDFTLLSEELEWMVVDYSDDVQRKPRPSAMTNAEIDRFLDENQHLPEKFRARFVAEQWRRYTSSFACLAFAMIGVPMGIKARRRDTSSGLVISLGIGALYFLAGSVLESPSEDGQWILWIPNLACIALGILLFRRARFR
ncbi:LptF/LptG family permease [Haloferula sp. A504]|uniref:LptF/LptG family permease n=1 Tax=Haloferula sp. A504 TaxID=3373601 RepID=UPI0031C5BD5C|nr:LptF/LptG family permease [Verrucomicrobiaceae bacterium E54]